MIAVQTENLNDTKEELNIQISKLDSIQAKLEEIVAEKESLGEDVAALEATIEKLKNEKNYLARNFLKPSVRREMEAKIVNYEGMLNKQDQELLVLRARNDSLNKYTVILKEEIVVKQDTIAALEQVREEQREEIEKGRVLRADKFKVTAVKNPKKNKLKYSDSQIYRNKDLKQTQIEFEISPNAIALIGEREVYVQIITPDNDIMHDENKGGGKFTIDDEEKKYSVKQNIMYDKNAQDVKLIFEKPADFNSGRHKIRVFCEGHNIGSGEFTVK